MKSDGQALYELWQCAAIIAGAENVDWKDLDWETKTAWEVVAKQVRW